ncbi:M56 family metallopeptidase [Anaerobaca lacustris]|uniref:M56 family metallopeptidase n=1 Tax=Anaerobaca lacustris TaxID=3044600 RepID=A0AAW6U318_9BACT|nr:M56 family metallopeptidase [Sedimentisphaerales bacterium M17dextr]
MDRVIDSGIETLNGVGEAFCSHAWSVFLQVSVLIAVLLVADLLLRRRVRAVVRYAMWTLVFLKLVLPPTLSLPTGIGYYRPEARVTSQEPTEPVLEQPAPIAEVRPVRHEPVVASPPVVDLSHANVVPAPALPAIVRPAITWQGLVFLGWLAGVLTLSIYLLRRVQYVRKLIHRSTPASETLSDMLTQCAAVLRLRSCPALRLSDDAPGPAVCGLFRPVVLLPASLAENLRGERLRTVLVHELAHVRRADLWVNFAQTLLLVAYFYHPLLWLANAVVRRLREQAVDETVLVALDAEAESYGTTLIDLAEMTNRRPALGLRLIGIAESRRALEGRIRHMITQPKPRTAKLGLCGLLAIATTAAVLLPMARAEDRSKQDLKLPTAKYKILLLEDRNDQDGDKDQYDDRLYLIDSSGHIEGAITGFHIGGSVGGAHVLAVDEQRRTLWVVENRGDRLWHFDLAGGKLLRKVPMPGVTAAAVDPATGNVWCTISAGRLGEGILQVISPSAEPVATHPIAGLDITHSVRDNSFWVVGKTVYRIGTNGKLLAEVPDQIPWTAVSVSVDQKTGNAWVVVRDHPQVPDSRSGLWVVDRNVRIQQRIDLGELMPFCVAVDSDNEVVWVGCLGTTLRYTTRGEKLKSARYASGFSVVPGRTPNEVFAAHEHGLCAAAVEASGAVSLGGFPMLGDHLSSGRKWLARVPFADAKLQSSPELADLARRPPKPEQFAPESAQKLAVLGKALLIYANDYGDRFPETLQGVRTFVGSEDFAWLMQNVVYLGKGKTISVRPDTIMAYDRTLLEKGEGTLVLFADSLVASKSLRELEALGIDVAAGPSAAARHKSATQLSALGKAMLIYADDHDDTFPDTLEQLKSDRAPDSAQRSMEKELTQIYGPRYAEQMGSRGSRMDASQLAWYREHVRYLGQDVKATDDPARVLAYDQTLLAECKGTNVLHVDATVEFVTPEQFAARVSQATDYARVVVEEGVGFDGIVVGRTRAEFIKSKLGEPDQERNSEETGWWLDYRHRYGLQFRLDRQTGSLVEIQIGNGFKGSLRSGISMFSTMDDVFGVYGRPREVKTVGGSLTTHSGNQVLYQRMDLLGRPAHAKIHYQQDGLVFWFVPEKIQLIVVHEARVPEQAIVPAATSAVSPEARANSAMRLKDLGKTLLIYANDHDDKLPDELMDVRRQYGVGFSWLYDNVAYLGKGMTVRRDRPKRPTAYDTTLIRSRTGTNVLYLDTQVAFESPARLDELGIRYEPKPKSAEELRQEAEIQARVTVLSHLKQLALAAHLYASDNDGVFPDTLEMLEPYLKREEGLRVWVRENVEYTGKGLNPANEAERSGKPIAYSRLGPEEAVVAFLDGHVEYVIGPRLKELGIEIQPGRDR